MKHGRLERHPSHCGQHALLVATLLAGLACAPPKPSSPVAQEALATQVEVGQPGGRLVVALTAEPKTFNPVIVGDLTSRAVVHRMTADLIRIDRESQETVPALAESWTVSGDGRRYTLKLRPELRFSDGHPAGADDVIFSFRVYLDETVASPQRDLLLFDGKPLNVRKIGPTTVEFELPEPYAAAERLFDGFAILPQHRLEEAYEAGHLAAAWGPRTSPVDIVGLGPFRLKEYRLGEHLVLERNPHYWDHDDAGQQLPYLDEIVFLFTPEETQTLRFLAGDLDIVNRLSPENFAALDDAAKRRGYRLYDLGAGLDYHFLFFNLNDLVTKRLPQTARKQRWFHQLAFRQAVLAAIDLESIVRLVFQGRATPLASHMTPGSQRWVNRDLEPPRRSLDKARLLLQESGFRWDADGQLRDDQDQRVGFSLLTIASRPQTTRTATMIQNDLQQLGIDVQVTTLELGAVLERLFETHDYDACLLALGGSDADPNPAMNVLLSSGSHHLWRLGQAPTTPWQAEIDRLMQQQLSTLDPGERKRLVDRVQHLVAENLPMLSLVSPNVLVGAKQRLGNFRPAILPHHTLWNVEELFWKPTDS